MPNARNVQRIESVDDEVELVIDREFRNPAPLDRRIATVSLKSPTNNPTDGYDVVLSATFGKERVTLTSADFEIEVDFSISTADIELNFVDCYYTEIDETEGGRVEEWKQKQTKQSRDVSRASGRIGGGLSLGNAGARSKLYTGGQLEESAVSISSVSEEINRHLWYRLGPDTLRVGRDSNRFLDGPVITNFRGWHVTPRSTRRLSGVVARVKVRENWIRFDDVRVTRTPPNFVEKIRNLMSQKETRRRRYFDLLLRHLAQTELREHQDATDATIASHILLVRPNEMNPASIYAGDSRRQIAVNGNHIAKYLSAPEGHEVSALIALGLRPEVIHPVAVERKTKRARRGRFFIPDSAPPHAAETFAQIHSRGEMPKCDVLHPPALHDLRGLKLIATNRSNIVRSVAEPGLDANLILRRAVSEMECIRVAREVLRINSTATPIEVADAVAMELGYDWPTVGTKCRNGNAIIRWTVWLEPHLLDVTASSDAAARVAYATEAEVMKGRPSSLRKTLEPELRRLLSEGLSVIEIAKRLNVAHTTIYDWKRRLRL